MNNFYFFVIDKIHFDKSNSTLYNNLNKNLIKIFYLNKNYKIKDFFFNSINFIYVAKTEDLIENDVIKKNKDCILFFLYNEKLYSINFLDIITNKNFLNLNFKKYYVNFFFLNFYNIKKIIFILKLNIFLKKCQH